MTEKRLSPLRLKDIKTGRMEERNRIVEWLRNEEAEYPASQYSGFAAMIAKEIEVGEHLI